MRTTTITLEVTSPEQAALLQQFRGFLQEMEQLALSAPHGQVLDLCEAAAVSRGQEVNRQVLQQAVQQRLGELEKKVHRCAPAAAASHVKTAAPRNAKSRPASA